MRKLVPAHSRGMGGSGLAGRDRRDHGKKTGRAAPSRLRLVTRVWGPDEHPGERSNA
jgi:hypothetical protein